MRIYGHTVGLPPSISLGDLAQGESPNTPFKAPPGWQAPSPIGPDGRPLPQTAPGNKPPTRLVLGDPMNQIGNVAGITEGIQPIGVAPVKRDMQGTELVPQPDGSYIHPDLAGPENKEYRQRFMDALLKQKQ